MIRIRPSLLKSLWVPPSLKVYSDRTQSVGEASRLVNLEGLMQVVSLAEGQARSVACGIATIS